MSQPVVRLIIVQDEPSEALKSAFEDWLVVPAGYVFQTDVTFNVIVLACELHTDRHRHWYHTQIVPRLKNKQDKPVWTI